MIDEGLINQIKTALQAELEVVAAYVIGSIVSGKATSESDFDLAVVVRSRKKVGEDKIYDLIKTISFPKDLDLSVVDKSSSPLFLFQMVSKGKTVYVKNQQEMVEFEVFAMHNYYDTAHLRKIYDDSLEEKFLGSQVVK